MTSDLRTSLATALTLALALSLHTCAARAHGQASDELLTARVCWSEGGPSPRECAAVVHATAERAVIRGVTYRQALTDYSPRATVLVPYVGRSWVPLLSPDVQSRAFPRRARERMRVQFAALVHVAWRAIRGIEPPPCPGALEWGSRFCKACTRRMERAGYVRRCSFANDWWGPA